ncbi:MAG: polysaccharide deacetylase family protein [Thiolinea sp.]
MIFSADIEDWQQSVWDFKRPISRRVLVNTWQLLDILARYQVKGTFFVQGMVSKAWPELIREISAQGHELASHAWSHRPLYELEPEAFRTELRRSVDSLQQISGQKVIGFRAPTFSLQEYMLDWYCDALHEQGIRYDSSVMLAQVRKAYGFGNDRILEQLRQRGIESYPLSVAKVMGKSIPVMGGGYFRIFPYGLTKYLARQLNPDNSIFYMHPYELDVREYREIAKPDGISLTYALHQFGGRRSMHSKLPRLLRDYHFTSFRQYYYPDKAKRAARTKPEITGNGLCAA